MPTSKNIRNTIIIAALGYFVDIYDLIIFSIIRVKSLASLGLSADDILKKGMLIINVQMVGMLIGGIIWGIMGDKKGRIQVLFGSIVLYSIANIANAYIHSVNAYVFWRFIAGIGLAGELGAGITLVAESMPKDKRGYGTSIVAGFGILGAVLAYALAQAFDWRSCFQIGGVLGISLLFLRMGLTESTLFEKTKHQANKRGQFSSLFTNKNTLKKYLQCIAIGIPIWFVVGILMTFADKFSKELNIQGEVLSAKAVMLCYIGLALGDFCSGFISQLLQSRKKTLYTFFIFLIVSLYLFFSSYQTSSTHFYFISFLLGFASGYWAIFITIGAEQFGTNIRATASTTIPNFVRGSLPLLSLIFSSLQSTQTFLNSAITTSILCLSVAAVSTFFLRESFQQDLDFVE